MERAEVHRHALDSDIKTWLGANPYALVADEDVATRHKVFRLQVNVRPDLLGWGIILGDAVHNLRAALDHVVWQLAELKAQPPDHTEFPIFHSRNKFGATDKHGPTRASGLSKIVGLPVETRHIVERAQPYHRGGEAHLHPLWVLHRLNNLDKHRVVIPALFVPNGYVAEFTVNTRESRRLSVDPVTWRREPLEDGAVVFTVDLSMVDRDVEINVSELHFDVCVDLLQKGAIPGSRHRMVPFLDEASQDVRQVIAEAAHYF